MYQALSKIITFFSTPLVKNPDDVTKAKSLNALWSMYFFLIIFYLLSAFFVSQNLFGSIIIFLLTESYMIGIGLLKNKGKIRVASFLLVILTWVLMVSVAFVSGGFTNVVSAILIAIITGTGLLLGRKSAFIVAFCSIIANVLFIVIDTQFYRFPRIFPLTPLASLLYLGLAFVIVIVPLELTLGELLKNISLAKENETKYKNLSDNLEEIVKTRTYLLEKANEDLKFFSYSLSHDFKSHIEKIGNLVDLAILKNNSIPESEIVDYLQIISASNSNIKQLSDELLIFFNISHGTLSNKKIKISSIIDSSLLTFSNFIEDYNIQKKLQVDDLIEVDPILITQVWTNLISNSMKFSQKREIKNIEIGNYSDQKGIIYYIKDNGVGFNMKDVDKLFNVFQRLHPQEEFPGTGIGLALVKRIIEKHGGEIWVESELNRGSTFFFRLN